MAEVEQVIQKVVVKERRIGLFSKEPEVTLTLASGSVRLVDDSDPWNKQDITLALSDLDDVVVVNKHSESRRIGAYGGRGVGMWSSSGKSRTVGDMVFMSKARDVFRISQIRDPYGLKALILSTKKQDKAVSKK